MQDPRKHHYIPVFYLKQWAAGDRRLCEYRRVTPGKIATHRKSPDATGYKLDLYRLDGVPRELAQAVERIFMQMVDTQASRALDKLKSGDSAPWDDAVRSGWTRFLLSLLYRNPEAVQLIKERMLSGWKNILDEMRNTYDTIRYEGDPPTFEEFLAKTDPAEPAKAALRVLQETIDNPRLGQAINNMKWQTISLSASKITLLTSDRPLDLPLGLGNEQAYIALPIGPQKLFIAEHGDAYAKRVASADPTDVVKVINKAVVEQAREFVWGIDDAQSRYVADTMTKKGDRPLTTDGFRPMVSSNGASPVIAERC